MIYLFNNQGFLSKNQYKSIPLFLQVTKGDSSDSMLDQGHLEFVESQPGS